MRYGNPLSPPTQPLLAVLHKMTSLVEETGTGRLLVAGETKHLPAGFTMRKARPLGKRVSVKGPRSKSGFSAFTARWPQDSLVASRVPILLYVLGGQISYQVGEYIIDCGENSLILVPAGVPYPDSTRSMGNKLDVLALSPWDGRVFCRLCHNTGPNCFVLSANAIQIFGMFAEEAMDPLNRRETICSDLLLLCLRIIQREVEAGHFLQSGNLPVAALQTKAGDPIEQAQHYIQSHLGDTLTLDKVSRAVCMSRAQFTRRFRESTGQSFIEYLTACRLREAKVMLRETDWPIAMICDSVGLRDTSQLRRIFHRHEAMSLTEYRNRSRAELHPGAGRS